MLYSPAPAPSCKECEKPYIANYNEMLDAILTQNRVLSTNLVENSDTVWTSLQQVQTLNQSWNYNIWLNTWLFGLYVFLEVIFLGCVFFINHQWSLITKSTLMMFFIAYPFVILWCQRESVALNTWIGNVLH